MAIRAPGAQPSGCVRKKLLRRATAAAVERSSDELAVVLAGPYYRLQKSTNGARLTMPSSEELEGSPVGLASLRESEREAKERRKPNRRWQSREIGGGSSSVNALTACASTSTKAFVDGRRPGPGKLRALTCTVWQRSWLLASWPSSKDEGHTAGGDRGCQRPFASLARGRKRRGKVVLPPGDTRPSSCSAKAVSSASRSKLGTRRQARAHPGPGRRKAGWRCPLQPASGFSSGRWGESGRRGESCERGSRAVHECSYLLSVAEVGEKHLSLVTKGSRKATRGDVR